MISKYANKTSKSDKLKIVELYKSGLSSRKIGKIFNLDKSTVLDILHNREIYIRDASESKREFFFNENYFDKIDTEDKAYFLGFLYADGYNNEKKHVVSLNLQEQDSEVLYKFKNYIRFDGNIYTSKRKNERCQNQSILSLNSQILSGDLAKWGCFQAKSFTLKWPQDLNENLFRHFIRGYFDGDGSICKPECKKHKLSIVSTNEFCNFIKDFCKLNFNIHFSKEVPKRYRENNKNICIISLNGRQQMLVFLDWIYEDSTVFLKRKYERYISCKNLLVGKYITKTDRYFNKIVDKDSNYSYNIDMKNQINGGQIA